MLSRMTTQTNTQQDQSPEQLGHAAAWSSAAAATLTAAAELFEAGDIDAALDKIATATSSIERARRACSMNDGELIGRIVAAVQQRERELIEQKRAERSQRISLGMRAAAERRANGGAR
jgi:hypothetical protein